MGYNTFFTGEFEISLPLMPEHRVYLEAFSRSRRMERNAAKTEKLDDPRRVAVGLPVGNEGEFFVGEVDNAMGQTETPDVTNHNRPPATQPSLWCQWVPNEDGTALRCDEGENFDGCLEWLDYMIEKFFKPWGYTLNGQVRFSGDDPDDHGLIVIVDNQVDSAWDTITNRLEGEEELSSESLRKGNIAYKLAEAISDISMEAHRLLTIEEISVDDSRYLTSQIIAFAEDFETRDYDESDYMDLIYKFAELRLREEFGASDRQVRTSSGGLITQTERLKQLAEDLPEAIARPIKA